MHVIVVGCGRVGSELAARLSYEGHSTVIIDKNSSAFRRLSPTFSGKTITGLGFDRERLEAAEIDRADALAAVTSGDNSNILTARIAKETFEVPKVVARIYDPKRAEIYQRLGIATVATVTWTTEQAMRRLFEDYAQPDWIEPHGGYVLLERGLPLHMTGHRLTNLTEIPNALPILLTRGTSAKLFNNELVAQEGDVVHFMVERGSIQGLDKALFEIGKTQ